MSDKRLRYLFHRWFDKTATEDERAELMALVGRTENDDETHALLQEAWEKLGAEEKVFSEGQSQAMLHKILRSEGGRTKIGVMRRWMAAAAVVLLLGALVWLLVVRRSSSPQEEKIASSPVIKKNKPIDVPAPNGNNAILTLGDGSTVVLDSAKNGELARQGDAQVSKANAGRLVYNTLGAAPSTIMYNTVSTRRGGQFQIVLPDGSKVWLNTVSSLRFPTAFTGTERVVELKGEAYFEVAKNAALPFVVHVNTTDDKEMDVRVLGTEFDVMAYDNEAEIRTTLLEGAVKVMKGDRSKLLAPGQQAKLDKRGGMSLDENADVELAMAWKNGFTSFKSADIQSIMRQVERWYDIDVVYEGDVPERTFSGGISRDANLSELIRVLETNKIHFKLEGRKLTVTP
ncbi:MAG TPA: FecR domain-containing protein [Puia sp.]|nr:FecR domain-containing protein [Puia sp.]